MYDLRTMTLTQMRHCQGTLGETTVSTEAYPYYSGTKMSVVILQYFKLVRRPTYGIVGCNFGVQ